MFSDLILYLTLSFFYICDVNNGKQKLFMEKYILEHIFITNVVVFVQ